jgi:O-antigen/teichoic acid export membrane protein
MERAVQVSKALSLARISTRGGFNLFWGVAASSIISALGVILVARILGPEEYGLVAIVLVAPNLITTIRNLGIDQATIKYTAQYHHQNKPQKIKNILATATTFELLAGTLFSLTLFLLSPFLATSIFNRPELTPLIQLASFSILGEALFKAAQSAFTGYEKMELHSTIRILQSTLKAGLMILLILLGFGVYGAILGATIAHILTGTVSIALLYLTTYKKLNPHNDSKLELLSTTKNMLNYGLPLSLSTILIGFLPQFYVFLAAIYLSDSIIGNYQAAINFSVLVTFVATPITTTLFPVFSKLDPQKEPQTLRNIFRHSVKYASLLVVPATFMIIALSQPAVSTIYGTQYQYTPLYLSLYIIFYLKTAFGNISTGNLLKGQEKTQLLLKLNLLTFILGVIIAITLIPIFGIPGLIAAYITAEIPGLTLSLYWIKKHYTATIDWTSSAKILLSSAAAAAITYTAVFFLNLANWITLIIGAIIYTITYLITSPLIGAINKTDTKNLKEMLKALGPLAPIFNIPLNIIEKLTLALQKE